MTGMTTSGARLAGILLAVMSCLVAGPIRSDEHVHGHSPDPAGFEITLPKQRVSAPNFGLPDLANQPVTLDNYRGRIVLIHFWATFCLPCRDEMPALESLWQRYGADGLVVLGIAADRGSIEVVRDFAQESGLTFPVLHDASGTVRNRYEVTGLPTSYLIGRDGRISGRTIGMRDWNTAQARAYIESLL